MRSDILIATFLGLTGLALAGPVPKKRPSPRPWPEPPMVYKREPKLDVGPTKPYTQPPTIYKREPEVDTAVIPVQKRKADEASSVSGY
ncbi:MAG: hypothetical protein Q9213_003293 [Squamulea squamosa]